MKVLNSLKRIIGRGNSATQILQILENRNIWKVSIQKHLIDRF